MKPTEVGYNNKNFIFPARHSERNERSEWSEESPEFSELF